MIRFNNYHAINFRFKKKNLVEYNNKKSFYSFSRSFFRHILPLFYKSFFRHSVCSFYLIFKFSAYNLCLRHALYIKYVEDQVNITLIKRREVSQILKIILEFLTHINHHISTTKKIPSFK
jgi:hypothetical protein